MADRGEITTEESTLATAASSRQTVTGTQIANKRALDVNVAGGTITATVTEADESVIMDATTPYQTVVVSTALTSITCTIKEALFFGLAGDAAASDVYYWNFNSAAVAPTVSTGWTLKPGQIVSFAADVNQTLTLTIRIAKSTGSGNVVLGLLDKV